MKSDIRRKSLKFFRHTPDQLFIEMKYRQKGAE